MRDKQKKRGNKIVNRVDYAMKNGGNSWQRGYTWVNLKKKRKQLWKLEKRMNCLVVEGKKMT